MKSVIRRTWLAAQIIFAGAIAVPAHAQSDIPSVSGTFTIIASVVTPLALVVTHPLDFGRMLSGTDKVIAPSATNAGQFELSGQAGSNVSVALSIPSSLVSASGSSIPITGWTYLIGTGPTLTGSPIGFNIPQGAQVAATFPGTEGATKLYFAIGATVVVPTSATAPAYTGTGHITAAYADL